jgi:hypothetical protein
VKFKLFGKTIEASHLSKDEAADQSRLMVLNDHVLAEVPRLRRQGHAQFGGLGKLVDQGWTAEEIGDVVDSWSTASYQSLTMLVSTAGQIREQGISNVEEINAWLHAICEEDDDGKVVPRLLVRRELAKAGLPKNPAVRSRSGPTQPGRDKGA